MSARLLTRRAERGITMVETLVALVVLSIGMLGIAALYVETMRANRTAMVRGHGVELVNDMVDRIRANARAQGAYDMGLYGGNPAKQSCVNGPGNCTDIALAQDDLAWWKQSVLATLPGNPTANVQYFAGGANVPDRYQVGVTWSEPSSNPNTPSDNYTYQSNLELIPVVP